MASTSNSAATPSITVPDGFKLHRENSASILLQTGTDGGQEAFLNPVQEFNRDLSVACIRVWSEEADRVKEARWRERMSKDGGANGAGRKKGGRKKRRTDGIEGGGGAEPAEKSEELDADGTKDSNLEGPTVPDAQILQAQAGTLPGETAVEPMSIDDTLPSQSNGPQTEIVPAVSASKKYTPHRFVLLEALSATGLRAIRYAKEIPLVKYVIANDLSPDAVNAIKRNVDINELGGSPSESSNGTVTASEGTEKGASTVNDDGLVNPAPVQRKHPKEGSRGKVHVNEGDACSLMYAHRSERQRVDCVDLDPYGTAAPFIDAAVQCVNDGGLLCITCTDMTVLATNNYPEKCFSNYGGIPVKAEYCHEAALRLVLHTVSTSAGRYGRYIHPLLSLSIDFYVRLFIRVHTAPIEVKKAASKTSTYYVCSSCQSFYDQPLGKVVEKESAKSGQVNLLYRQRSGPPVGDKCPECESVLHVAGPMWSGPIHDPDFTAKVLEHIDGNMDKYGTSTRMKGMLTVAKEELDTPFYFTPSRVAGFFHTISPSLEEVSNAILHAGYPVSRSHALPGSLKTTATRQDVHDIFRCWVKEHPVKPESISPTSPSHFLHAKEPRFEANFSHHPQSVTQSSKVKLVRYQQNPAPNWGPGTKAAGSKKRKREDNQNTG